MPSNVELREIELLAPAKDSLTAIEAINYGADAVYIGAENFGARSAAGNSLEDIAKVVNYAHKFNVKVYVTVNTLIYDNELSKAEKLIKNLYKIGVDALIIQDMGILRMDIPPIELHASTQCDIRTPEKAAFLESVGFSQLVLARELSHDEISAIRQATKVKLESFIHGALCVSYSGRCQVSEVLKKRSANRGECAQICRLPFDLIDSKGNVLMKNKHLLSLKDFNQSDNLLQLLNAGIDSFKIEGRLKDINYVRNVVSYYREKLDKIILQQPDNFKSSSRGVIDINFTPDIHKSFNRGFTHYFFDERNLKNGESIASINTPKSLGEEIGRVDNYRHKILRISSNHAICNGDGLSFFDKDGNYTGFRVNRADGEILSLSNDVNITRNTILYRTFDKQFEDALNKSNSKRKIKVKFTLSVNKNIVALEAIDERQNNVVCHIAVDHPIDKAKIPQEEKQRETLSKTGNTIYIADDISTAGEFFIPQSILADLRRKVVEMLDVSQNITYRFKYRKTENRNISYISNSLTYADNVSNHLAEQFYKEHHVTRIEPALEVQKDDINDKTVMHTRYCLRRELGACKKYSQKKHLPNELFLRNGNMLLSLTFDCTACEMHVKVVRDEIKNKLL